MKNLIPEMLAVAAIDRLARVERNRADGWMMVSLRDRQRAVGVAGLTKDRADDTLDKFTDAERAAIVLALSAHCAQMQWIADCMSGAPSRVLH